MADLPTGTVTFLFTDVEGSTRLWESAPDAMRDALGRHDEILRRVTAECGGSVFSTAGDSFAVVFPRAGDAVAAAVECQRELAAASWPGDARVRVRMGLHTGEATERDGDYFGSAVNRAARLMSAAHGGQVVVSAATHDVVGDAPVGGVGFVELGSHRLKDLASPVEVFAVVAEGLETGFGALRTLDAAPNNLPIVDDVLVGRDEAVAGVVELLGQRRLVTVIGVGGMGKTRLALEAAASQAGEFVDGVWLCELASVSDDGTVAEAVGDALGARRHPGRSMVDSVAEFCRRRRMLLVLDNCEHVVDAVAELVEAVSSAASGVTVLATSREALMCAHEQVFPLGPLPSAGTDSAAVALFERRVAEVAPGRVWSDDERRSSARICERLDGMPLALELAAGRARSLSLADIERHLDEVFRILRGGRRRLERHQTMEAAIEWSYSSLHDAERVLFERLSVFAGGFSLAGAEAVVGDDDMIDTIDVLDLLDTLVAKSLVALDSAVAGATRYRVLEPLRQFGEARLAARGDSATIRSRHLAYFVDWAEHWRESLLTAEPDPGGRLDADFANIRSAVSWAVETGDVDHGLRAVAALADAQMAWLKLEVCDWATSVLELPDVEEHPLAPAVAGYASNGHWWRGDAEKMVEMLRRAERMPTFDPTTASPATQRAVAMMNLGGDLYVANEILDAVQQTDLESEVLVAWSRIMLNFGQRSEEAATVLERVLAETDGPLMRARAAGQLATVCLTRGEMDKAADLARHAITNAESIGARFFVHLHLVHLGLSVSATGRVTAKDLARMRDGLREQRDAGQIGDQWLILIGAAAALHRIAGSGLAAAVQASLGGSQWGQSGARALLPGFVPGVIPDDPDHQAEPLDILVDRTIATIDRVLDDLAAADTKAASSTGQVH